MLIERRQEHAQPDGVWHDVGGAEWLPIAPAHVPLHTLPIPGPAPGGAHPPHTHLRPCSCAPPLTSPLALPFPLHTQNFGVDVNSGGVVDTYDAFVWEPSLVKLNAIASATEAACLILSVDETVRNPKSEQMEGQAAAAAMGGRGRGRGGMMGGRGRGMRR